MITQRSFAYRARDVSGTMVTGTMSASVPAEVSSRLRADGKTVISVSDRPMVEQPDLDRIRIKRNQGARSIRRDDVIVFCEQMSVMLETGVPLAEAMESYCRQVRRPEQRVVFESLRDDILSGETFSTAAMKWPRAFPRIMTSLLRASEASGTLAPMLGRIGQYLRKEQQTFRQIRGALTYPLFMVIAALSLSTFLMVFVLPRFATIYEGRSAVLPAPTRLLLALSDFLSGQWHLYVPACLVAATLFILWSRTNGGRRTLDWTRLNVPVIGSMYRKLYVSRASRTMATLMQSNVNLFDIIEICRGVTGNRIIDELWDETERNVRDGKEFADAFQRCRYVSPNVASMISAGDRSGRLGAVMGRVAEFTDQELDVEVKQCTAFIEPVMIMIMGIVVGAVAIALLLPIFRMGTVMAG